MPKEIDIYLDKLIPLYKERKEYVGASNIDKLNAIDDQIEIITNKIKELLR